MVGALSTSPSSSANSSYSSFFPLHTTYCIGLKEISFFGNTANRNAPCNTAENSLRYPLLSAFAVVPQRLSSSYACKCSAVTVFSFLSPIGYFFILFTVPIYAITVPLLKLPGFSSSSPYGVRKVNSVTSADCFIGFFHCQRATELFFFGNPPHYPKRSPSFTCVLHRRYVKFRLRIVSYPQSVLPSLYGKLAL